MKQTNKKSYDTSKSKGNSNLSEKNLNWLNNWLLERRKINTLRWKDRIQDSEEPCLQCLVYNKMLLKIGIRSAVGGVWRAGNQQKWKGLGCAQ